MQVDKDASVSAPSHESYDGGDRPTKRRKRGAGLEALLAREVGFMREGGSSTSFVGSASGIHFIRSVYGVLGSPMGDSTSPETNLVPGEDDRLNTSQPQGAEKLIWTTDEITPSSQCDFNDLLSWTASYFDHWHPAFPLLHAPEVLKFMEDVAAGNARVDLSKKSPETIILKSIVSLSLLDRRQSIASQPVIKKVSESLVFRTFDEAVESTSFALTRPATIIGLQAVLCVQIFLVSMLRLNVAARLEGLITQMAYQLGLHRCPMRYQSFSVEDRQLRKRVFWSMYCIERYLCQALGLPLTIRDEDVDVCHLNKEQHQMHSQRRMTSSTDAERASSADSYDERLQLLCFLAEHAQLRGSIIELRNKRVEERDKRPDTATLINARLTQWWNEAEDFFEQSDTEVESTVSPLHKSVLQVLRHESIIMLYRPLLALPKDNPNYAGAVHACIGAAKSLLGTLSSLLSGSQLSGQVQRASPMMWPSFTWASWMSAFIVLYGAAEGVVATKVASRNVDKALRTLENLALRGNIWPDACAVAIRDLRSVLTQKHDLPSSSAPSLISHARETAISTNLVPILDATNERGQNHEIRQQGYRSSLNQNVRLELVSQNPLDRGNYDGGTNNSGSTSTHMGRPQEPAPRSSYDEYHLNTVAFPNATEESALDVNGDEIWLNSNLLPKDIPPIAFAGLDPFQGFDIPFWVGQDNYTAWMGGNG